MPMRLTPLKNLIIILLRTLRFSLVSTNFALNAWKSLVPQSADHEFYKAYQAKELNELIDKGVFVLVPAAYADGHRICGSSFVDKLKKAGTHAAYTKSRPFFQAFRDKTCGIVAAFPTV